MTWCLNKGRISLCLMYLSIDRDQTPSWLPSSPKGEIVGNMILSVVLDGNPLDEDDGNPLDEDDGNLLNEVVLDA